MQVIFFSFLNCVILWHSIVYSLLLWSRWNRSKFLLVCHGKRTEWSRIRSVILRVITTSICLLRVGLQTELDDAKSHYQLFIKITISDKRRIAKLLKKGKICFKRKIKEASIVWCRSENYYNEMFKGKFLHFEESPNSGFCTLFLWWLKPRL